MSTEDGEHEFERVEEETDADVDDSDDATAVSDGEDADERRGTPEDTRPPEAAAEDEGEDGTETVPSVELDLYDLSVRVSGQSTDDLDAVEGTARSLMEYLVEQAHALEDQPDDRGLN